MTARALLRHGRSLQNPEAVAARREDLRRRRAALAVPCAADRPREPRASGMRDEVIEMFDGFLVARTS